MIWGDSPRMEKGLAHSNAAIVVWSLPMNHAFPIAFLIEKPNFLG